MADRANIHIRPGRSLITPKPHAAGESSNQQHCTKLCVKAGYRDQGKLDRINGMYGMRQVPG